MLDSLFTQLLAMLTGVFLVIPVDNGLGLAFVVLNGILLILATLLGLASGTGFIALGG